MLRDGALQQVVDAFAGTDPEHACHLANSITNDYDRARAVEKVARAVARTDSQHAWRLATSVSNESVGHGRNPRESAMAGVVEELASTDPDHAEHLAQQIDTAYIKQGALAHVVRVLADSDLDRAEHLAGSLTISSCRAQALHTLLNVLADTDVERATRLAQSIADDNSKASALTNLAHNLAATDQERAVTYLVKAESAVDRSRLSRDQGSYILRHIAIEFSIIARTIASGERSSTNHAAHPFPREISEVIELADTNPDAAEYAAYMVICRHDKAAALRGIAAALSATDPDRGARLLADAEHVESEQNNIKTAQAEQGRPSLRQGRTCGWADQRRIV